MTSAEPTTVRISAGNDRVEVSATAGEGFRLRGSAQVTEEEDQITVSKVKGKLKIDVAAGAHLVIGTTSGRIEVSGPVGNTAIVTDSGRVEIESATSVDVRTESSRVQIGNVSGTCRVRSTSGRVEVGSCGEATISGDSARIELRNVNGAVDAHSVSGRIGLVLAAANDVHAETVSGRIDVSLPAGSVAHQPAEASPDSTRPPDCDCTVVARSTTGKVVVTVR